MRTAKGVAATALLLLAAVAVFAPSASARAKDAHRAMVEKHGSQVMPFRMNKTMHVFRTTADGGIETVVAKSVTDQADIALIREHLRKESLRFQAGDFSDPAYIHGSAMPGLAQLHAGAKQIAIQYAQLPAGASIRFKARDPKLVSAIHRWFAAQLHDHGPDARD
jgi:hypothetical protein